jgi:hypothetical protein
MIPYLIGGAVVAVGTLLAKNKSKCSVCDSRLTLNEDCLFDGKPVCSSCGQDRQKVVYKDNRLSLAGRCCNEHIKAHDEELAQKMAAIDKEIWTRAEAAKVITYSKNFQGKVEAPKLGKRIETAIYADKEEAELQLKILTLSEGCLLVQQVEFHKGKDDSTSYIRSTWRASGII